VSDGYLDTNVVVHAITRDEHSAECIAFLSALQNGRATAILDATVVHELTYILQRVPRRVGRQDVATHILSIAQFRGVRSELDVLVPALERWGSTPGLGFVDALLTARARMTGASVFAKNVRDFAGSGVDVPVSLPN
jgi:predicted nucleic acid-binding protein